MSFSSLSDFDKGWVVGIIEGEGCVTNNRKSLVVSVEMNDKDTIERFKDLLGWKSKVTISKRKTQVSQSYSIKISGWPAQLLMLDVFPYMSRRRKQRIQELILDYGK